MPRMHEPTPPTVNERGDETHPAFGGITAHRMTSTPGVVLFDSEITHSQFIRVTISGMTRQRDLKRDWLYENSKPYIEVDMSEAQWASFVSSMNTSAVPCTVRRTENEPNVPGLEFAPRLAISAQETKDAAKEAFAKIEAAFKALNDLDPKAGVKARRAAMRSLELAIASAPSNVEYASKSLTEHVENVVQKARADVEGMVVAHAKSLGIDPAQVQFAALESAPAEAPGDRRPYVGEGADGARRSAAIDRSEAETYAPGPERDHCLASAQEWDRQAERLEA